MVLLPDAPPLLSQRHGTNFGKDAVGSELRTSTCGVETREDAELVARAVQWS